MLIGEHAPVHEMHLLMHENGIVLHVKSDMEEVVWNAVLTFWYV